MLYVKQKMFLRGAKRSRHEFNATVRYAGVVGSGFLCEVAQVAISLRNNNRRQTVLYLFFSFPYLLFSY